MKSDRWSNRKQASATIYRNVELVIIIVVGSFVMGSLPFIYGSAWQQELENIRPTEAGLWQELGNPD